MKKHGRACREKVRKSFLESAKERREVKNQEKKTKSVAHFQLFSLLLCLSLSHTANLYLISSTYAA